MDMPIGEIYKNERLLGEGCEEKHGAEAAWERDLAIEIEGF